MIISGYANPHKNNSLKEALRSQIAKQVVEKVVVWSSLAFYNRLFIVPEQQTVTHLGSEQTQSFPQLREFQNGNSRDNQTFPPTGGVGHLVGLQRCVFRIPINPRSRNYLRFHLNSQTFQFTALPSDSSFGVYKGCEGGKTDDLGQGYKDPPVLRRLVASSPLSGDLFRPNPDPFGLVPKARVGSQFEEVRTNAATVQLCRLSFRPLSGSGQTHSGKVASPENKDHYSAHQFMSLIGLLTATEKHVVSDRLHLRPIQWHLKNHWHVPETLPELFIHTCSSG